MSDPALELTAVTRSPSLYETVSEQLLAAIRAASLGPGARIPSERELGERFGVSRTVIREAIRHLAAKGVLEVVSGSGVLVAAVGHENITESIDLYLRQHGPLDPSQIHEVREALELRTTELAATRATEEELGGLVALCDLMEASVDDPLAASEADVRFHRGIAEAAGNPLFLVLVDSIADVLLDARRATLDDADRGRTAAAAHRRIADALVARDASAAVQAMRDHLADSYRVLARRLDG